MTEVSFSSDSITFDLESARRIGNWHSLSVFSSESFVGGNLQTIWRFCNLKYDFRPVATEVISGRSVAFSKGNLVNSIIASATVPLRNSPVRIDSSIYLDGGLKANIPVDQAKEIFDPDIIIAVNTTSPLFTGDKLDKPWNLADQVLSIMMQDYSKEAKKHADVLIEPDIDGITNTDFDKAEQLISTR
jgi:NTE family protein